MKAFRPIVANLVLVLLLSSEISRSQPALSPGLSCGDFGEWTKELQEFRKENSIAYIRGNSSVISILADEGVHPRSKVEYRFTLSGRVIRKGSQFRADFELDAQTLAESKRVVFRKFLGSKHVYFDTKAKEDEIPLGKKALVWAGYRGPTPPWDQKLPFFVDVHHGKEKTDTLTLLSKETGSISEGGTIYYFPEGVLEIFTRRAPLVTHYVPDRIYLWAGGCSQGSYPAPWPRPLPR